MLRRALFRFARIMQKADCPPILNGARSSFGLKSRPRLEALETRDTPSTTFTWLGTYSTDATDSRNWLGGSPGQLPGSTDEIDFTAPPGISIGLPGQPPPPPAPSVNCDNLSGVFGTIHIFSNYTATVTFSGAVLAGNFTMEGGAISQPISGTDLAVGSSFTWTGGTLNSSANLANVNISGGTALIAPTGGGTVLLGSNINFANGAIATLE